MRGAEFGGLALALHVEDEIDVVLPEVQHILGAVFANGGEANLLEIAFEHFRLGTGELHELEPIGSNRVFKQIGHSDTLGLASAL